MNTDPFFWGGGFSALVLRCSIRWQTSGLTITSSPSINRHLVLNFTGWTSRPFTSFLLFCEIHLSTLGCLGFILIMLSTIQALSVCMKQLFTCRLYNRQARVTSHGGKSHHFVAIPMAQRHPTENAKVTKFSRDIAHTEIFEDCTTTFATTTNGTAEWLYKMIGSRLKMTKVDFADIKHKVVRIMIEPYIVQQYNCWVLNSIQSF